MKQILILVIFLLINTNTFADKKFEKDLKKTTLGGYHGLALTKCYADEEQKENYLINYLGKLF